MVLFNRSFEADIDVEKLEIVAQRQLSDSRELLLRLRWLAILSGSLRSAQLAVTGGVHSAVDAVKAVMCGASAIQMVSALLKHEPEHLSKVRQNMSNWMENKGYESLAQLHGPMNTLRTRANYIRLLQTWQWA
jgi:dihydroorotate dehydrogenase (fumarate)